jgi:hypothetical protein
MQQEFIADLEEVKSKTGPQQQQQQQSIELCGKIGGSIRAGIP